jgi:hypothetical protein
MTRQVRGQLRAADTDRDAIAERLAAAMAEGRLEAEEYEQRLGQAYAAKTYADLGRLVADLPASTQSTQRSASALPGAAPERTAQHPLETITAWMAGLPIGCLVLAVVLIVASVG